MAYVRKKGQQVAIVHGERDKETGKVRQRTLFTLYSKAEAIVALGDKRHWFRNILEEDNPAIRFDWKKIDAAIDEQMNELPDLYTYKEERVEGRFRGALCGFAKELLLADPQSLIASARMLQDQRHDLEYLKGLIDWRLQLCDQDESEWNQDNPFFWKAAMLRKEVPPDQWEELGELYRKRDYDRCEALARLLTDCWPNFARGYDYLGLVAMDKRNLEQAVEHFEEAMEVGRTLFPKRLRKDMWWTDHDTRPYIRAMCHLVMAHNRLGHYDKALALCDRLEQECHQEITAADMRLPSLLNAGLWELAVKAGEYVRRIYPQTNFQLAYAYYEAGQLARAVEHYLLGAMHHPRTARLLCDQELGQPETYDQSQDHVDGFELWRDLEAYSEGPGAETIDFFTALFERPEVAALVDEAEEVRRKRRDDRSGKRTWFDRMNEMRTMEFVRERAARLAP